MIAKVISQLIVRNQIVPKTFSQLVLSENTYIYTRFRLGCYKVAGTNVIRVIEVIIIFTCQIWRNWWLRHSRAWPH